jgi:tetratricopeptide (TPR) repeat protein
MVRLSHKHQALGDLDRDEALLDEALAMMRLLGDRVGQVQPLTYRGIAHFFRSEYQDAVDLLREGAQLATEAGDGFHLIQALFFLGASQGNLGRISEALATFNDTLAMSQRNGNRQRMSTIPNSIGWIHREMGDAAGSIEHDSTSAERARDLGVVEAETNAQVNLAHDYLQREEPENSLAALKRAEAICDRDRWHAWRFGGIRLQEASAEFWIAQNDLERASGHAHRLLENATRHNARKYIAVAHKLFAKIASLRDDAAGAEKELYAAIAVLEHHPAPLVAWQIYVALGRVQTKMGDTAKARQAFSQAAGIIRLIADQTSDERLRTTFLNRPEVREALAGAALQGEL